MSPSRHEVSPLRAGTRTRGRRARHDQNPHHRECQLRAPASQPPNVIQGGKADPPRIAAEDLALSREGGISVEDLEADPDHDDDGNDVHQWVRELPSDVAFAIRSLPLPLHHAPIRLPSRTRMPSGKLFQPSTAGVSINLRRRNRRMSKQSALRADPPASSRCVAKV